MWVLRFSLYAAFGISLAACAQSAAPPKFEPLWTRGSDGTMVHRPSGIRVSEEAGSFHKKGDVFGEWQDYQVFYARSAEQGAVLVSFSGIHTSATNLDTCDTMIDRSAGYADRKVWHKQRIGPWRSLAPFFPSMEAGRSATYDSEQRVDGSVRPMQAEVYILCGTDGSWIVQYRAEFPPDVQGSGWIPELIAATAPQS
jgi:hypothetical protein